MLITLDTSHLEMSPLNDDTRATLSALNKLSISFTDETSQDQIGPRASVKQLVGDSWRHSLTVAVSSALDFGAYPAVVYYKRSYTAGATLGTRIMIKLSVRIGLRGRGKGLG